MNTYRVIVAGWYTVDPEIRDAVVESFKDLVQRARNAHGCLDLAITADPIDPSRINNFEFWDSSESLDAWRSISNPPQPLTPMLRIEVQKHVIQSSGPPFD